MARRHSPRLDEDNFPVDAMNEIVPNLWIGDGDAQPDAAFADGFEVVVTLHGYAREPVTPPRGHVYVAWPIEDPLGRAARRGHAARRRGSARALGTFGEGI